MTARPARAAAHPIAAAARMTGLSVDTLRAWERRYAAVRPARAGRGRAYSDDDIARLRQLATLVDRGYSIGSIAGRSSRELAALIDGSDATPAPAAPAVDLAPVLAALDRYDLDALETELSRMAAVLRTPDLVFSVVLPLLREVGDRWQAGRLRPAQEHLVSSIIRTGLGGLLRAASRASARDRLVFAAPPGERHELGLLCAALLAATAGVGVVYLGADVPVADIAHAAETSGARGIVLAATMPATVTARDGRLLERAAGDLGVWIGGATAAEAAAAMGGRVRVLHDLADVVAALSHQA